MENNDYSIIALTEKNILSFKNYLPEDRLEWIRQKDVKALGLLLDKKTACGALMFSFSREEGFATLESICVDEKIRYRGLGSMLYEKFEDLVCQLGIPEINARIVIPADNDVRSFLEANGFDHSEIGERYYEFTKDQVIDWLKNPKAESLRKSLMKNKRNIATPVSKVSNDIKKLLPDIPHDPELSFVFDGKEKNNYSLADTDDEGNIIILNILLDMNDVPDYFLFLEAVMAHYAQMLSDDKKLYLTITSDREAEIAESLSFTDELEYYSRVDLVKTVLDVIPEKYEMPDLAFLTPRINGISKMLSDFGEGYEHTIAYAGDNATINILRGEDKPQVYLQYDLTDKRHAEGFELTIITAFNKDELNAQQLEKLSKWKDESVLCSFAEDDDGHIFARAALIEGKGLVNPAFLKTVLDSFMAEVDNLCGLEQLDT